MRRDTRAFYESKEAIETVRKTAAAAVLKRSKNLKILNVFVTLEDDPYDDDDYYYIIMVIYDDRAGRPKSGLEIGLSSALHEELDKEDLTPHPVFRIIPDSEYKEMKIEAA